MGLALRIRTAVASSPRLQRTLLATLFLALPLVVYPLGFVRAGFLDGGDDVLSNLPMLLHSARALLRLDLLWTPDLWMGTQLLEEPEFATFYLPRLLLLALSPVQAFALYVVFHYALAQGASYAYARALGLSRGAAVFGALVYAFSGFMLGHRGHTMYLVAGAWAPLFFMFLRRQELGLGRFSVLGAALSFAALPLNGALQLTAYLVAAALTLQVTRAVLGRSLAPLLVLGLVLTPGLLIGALQLLPSIGFSRELLDLPGEDYAFSTVLSYDPRLLPLLVSPLDASSSTELYSRIGGVALVLVCIGGVRCRDPMARGWLAVGVTALVLMLGRHVPVLPRVLHALPLVKVFRGPVRHNFELGLSVSVLAAFGFEAIFGLAREKRRLGAWLVGAVALGGLTFLLGALAVRSSLSTPDARALARAATVVALGTGAAFVALGVVMVALAGTRWRAPALGLVLVAPLAEARCSLARFDRVWPDWAAQLAAADIRTDPTRSARVLAPPLSTAGPDALAANTPLAFEGLGSVLGYASRAQKDAAAVFDLDMHGHARDPADLAWSRLPELFGVSYVILPEAVCPRLEFSMTTAGAGARCAEGASGVDVPLGVEELHCVRHLTDGRARFGVEVRRPRDVLPARMHVELLGRDPESAPATLDFEQRTPFAWFSEGRIPAHGWLTIAPPDSVDLVLDRLSFVEEKLEPIAVIDAHATPRLVAAAVGPETVQLTPAGGESLAGVSFEWPSWLPRNAARRFLDRSMVLEGVARAAEPPSRPLVIDLYGGPDFDPLTGQIAIAPAELLPLFTLHARNVTFPLPPPRVELRALYDGSGSVDIERVRLLAGKLQPLVSLPGQQVVGSDFEIGAGVRVGPFGIVKAEYHLPTRPLRVELELELELEPRPTTTTGAMATAATRATESVTVGLRADPSTHTEGGGQRTISLDGLSRPSRFAFTVDVPVTAGRVVPFVAGTAGSSVRVRRLEVEDACSARSLSPIQHLDSGWVVYRDADPLPRAFTVGQVRFARSLDDARHLLRDDSTLDPHASAVLLDGAAVPAGLVRGTIVSQRFTAQAVELEVSADGGPTLLVVNDRYQERWRATVDGASATILRANGLVRAVVVPPGTHTVRMRYVPPWTVPVGAAAAGFGFLLALGMTSRRPGRPPRRASP